VRATPLVNGRFRRVRSCITRAGAYGARHFHVYAFEIFLSSSQLPKVRNLKKSSPCLVSLSGWCFSFSVCGQNSSI
jgi:hypothetical protein